MTFVVNMQITADGKIAKAEIRDLKTEQQGLAGATKRASAAGKEGAASNRKVGSSARDAASDVQALSAAQRENARVAGTMRRSTQLSAGAVGNLTAQFNDIGLMLAAGQNPLQLAIQQGTQITQVIGPMGAAGAARALGAGLMSMLSPINLITIGSIAAGAAFTQWLVSGKDNMEDLTSMADDFADSVDAYLQRLKESRGDLAILRGEFGAMAEAARTDFERLAESNRRKTLDQADAMATTLTGGYGEYSQMHQLVAIGEQFDLHLDGINRKIDREIIGKLAGAYSQLDASVGGSLEVRIAAFERIIEVYEEAAAARRGVSEEEDATLQGLIGMVNQLRRMNAAEGPNFADLDTYREMREELTQQATIQRLIAQYGRDSSMVERERLAQERERQQILIQSLDISETAKQALMSLWDKANPGGEAFAKHLDKVEATLDKIIADQQKDLAGAQARLASLQEEAAIRQAIATYGEDSVEVARLMAAAERRVFEEYVAQLQVADPLKQALLEAWDNAKGLAGTDIASGIAAARSEARAMADEIMRALDASQALAAQGRYALEDAELRLEYANDPVELARQQGIRRMQRTQGVRREGADAAELAALDAEAVRYGNVQAEIARRNQQRLETLKSSRGRGSRAERDEVERLIEAKRLELDIMRETDPVAKEMLRNREALKNATTAQTEELEQLIAQEIAYQDILQQRELLTSVAYDAIDGLIRRGESLADVWLRAADAIYEAFLQATLLGEGPLAGMFGTSGGGGILGSLAEIIIPGNAEGGYQTGRGGPKDDKKVIRVSPGEYVVNAAATARNRHLLEAINSGAPMLAPGFAAGGAFMASPPVRPAARSDRLPEYEPAYGYGAMQINNFHISTPSARAFAGDRVRVARGARKVLAQAGRYA
ncbi:MAG: phage tail length tape measure family protein [Paracoccaceae bacterium]